MVLFSTNFLFHSI